MGKREFRNLPAVRENRNLSESMNRASENSSIAVYNLVSDSGRAISRVHGAITGRNRLKDAFERTRAGDFESRFGAVRNTPTFVTGSFAAVPELINLIAGFSNDNFMARGTVMGIWAVVSVAYLQLHSLYNTGKLLKPYREQKRLPGS